MKYFIKVAIMKTLIDIRKFLMSIPRRGLFETLHITQSALRIRLELSLDRAFDSRFKITTCGTTELTELTIDSPNTDYGVEYDPTPFYLIRRILENIPDAKDFVLVDFGSGKGRVLFVAAELRFKQIIGVEFSKELHEATLKNIATYRNPKQKCFSIVALHKDATDFLMPEDNCVLYFYAPFKAPIMKRVLAKVTESYIQRPRKIYLIYVNPFHKDLFDALPHFIRFSIKQNWTATILPDRLPAVMYRTP